MQLEVAAQSQGGICQEMQAIGEMEYEKFVWVKNRLRELREQVKQMAQGMGHHG